MVHTIPYGPTSGFPLNLLPLGFHSRKLLLIIAFMEEKQQNNLLKYIYWVWAELSQKSIWGNIVILASMRYYKRGKWGGNTQSPPVLYSKHKTYIPATNPTNQGTNIKLQGWTIACVLNEKGQNLANDSLIYGVWTYSECRKNHGYWRHQHSRSVRIVTPILWNPSLFTLSCTFRHILAIMLHFWHFLWTYWHLWF